MSAEQIGEGEKEEMSFLDHLEVLRWHLVRSAVAVMLFAVIAFVNKRILFDVIIFGPKQPDFLTFRFLCKVSRWIHTKVPALMSEDGICIGQNLPELQNISMSGQFSTHIMVSLIAGVIFAFPYVFFEIWRFINPALKDTERRASTGALFFSSVLFLSGVGFGYFVISPLSVNFFLNYSVSDTVINVPTLSAYITLVTTVVLACGIVFQLPIVVLFLTRTGLVSALMLSKFRRHAFVGSLILSAIITPPDVFSQLLVTLPLMLLYEMSIFMAKRVELKNS